MRNSESRGKSESLLRSSQSLSERPEAGTVHLVWVPDRCLPAATREHPLSPVPEAVSVKGEVSFPGLEAELREIVREEVARALQNGGAGGYFGTKSAATYLDTTVDAIKSMVRDGKLEPIRRKPYRLFTREALDRVATTEPEEWVAR